MRKIVCLAGMLLALSASVPAQEASSKGNTTYTFGYNEIPDGSNIPLVGFVNVAHGSQKSVHVGFVNTTDRNLSGAQFGFTNTIGRDMEGFQVGFINTTERDLTGIQAGFINTVGHEARGFQFGFINAIDQNIQGGQIGFINAVEQVQGFQAGFINATERVEGFQTGFINAAENVKGFQIGFINAAERCVPGLQVGFVNSAEVISGVQLGFINYAERLDRGIAIGFLSFVKHGGYKAFELSCNEMYPINASYKIGMERFYTFPILSYNPKLTDPWALGFGAGSIIPMNEEVYFNPELATQTLISWDYQQFTSLSLQFGHAFNQNLNVLAGPSLVWDRTLGQPFVSLRSFQLDQDDRLHIGMRAALRYRF